jgi:DNA polymerase-3 subunit beta
MLAEFETTVFLDDLLVLSRVIESKSAQPILGTIVFRFLTNGKLIMTSTDASTYVTRVIDIEPLEEECVFAIDATILKQSVASLKKDKFCIDYVPGKGEAIISAGASKIWLPIITDMNVMPAIRKCKTEGNEEVSLLFDEFKTSAKTVAIASDPASIIPCMTGIVVTVHDDTTELIGLSNFMLAKDTLEPVSYSNDIEFLISPKVLKILYAIKKDCKYINISIGKRDMLITVDPYVIVSRRMLSDILDWSRFLKGLYTTKVKVAKKILLEAINRSRVIGSYADNFVRLEIKKDGIIISTEGKAGSSEDKLPIELEGPEVVVAFNSSLVSKGLSVLNTEFVYLNVATSNSPVMVECDDISKVQVWGTITLQE